MDQFSAEPVKWLRWAIQLAIRVCKKIKVNALAWNFGFILRTYYDAGTEISGVSAPVVYAGLKLNMGRVNQAIRAPVTHPDRAIRSPL